MNTAFLASLLRTPWAMDAGHLQGFAQLLIGAYRAKLGHEAAERDPTPVAAAPRAAQPANGHGIAVINVFGPIVQRASMLGMCEGGVGCDSLSAQLRQAESDPAVGQVLWVHDSPGGSVFGVMELADEIRNAKKPQIAFANACSASASYWLTSACSEVWVTPSGQVGSIGVYVCHENVSQALENAGVSITLISAGPHKVETAPFAPLSDDAKANLQASVDKFYEQFTSAVAKGRGVPVSKVISDMGGGRMLDAEAAQKAGMVDKVGTFDQVVASMQQRSRRPGMSKARADAAIRIAQA